MSPHWVHPLLCTVVNCLSIIYSGVLFFKFSNPYNLLFQGRTAVLPSFLADAVAVFLSSEISFPNFQGWIICLVFLFVFVFNAGVLQLFPVFLFLISIFNYYKCRIFISLLHSFSFFQLCFFNQPLSCFSFLNFILYFSLSPHFLSEIQFHRM